MNHIDDNAIANLTRYYSGVIAVRSKVLDIASSWVSHLPRNHGLEVTGLGLNKHELDANPLLSSRMVKDLNADHILPLECDSVDAVICNVSIDYLTKPRELCLEVARVLRPGGTLHLAISNRCFPTKVVSKWLRISEPERLQMVAEYLWFCNSADGSQQVFKDIECVEVVNDGIHDPLHVIRGTKI